MEFFTTSDIGLVAALMSWGLQYDTIDKNDSAKIKFIFTNSSDLDGAIRAYYANTLQVPALSFHNNIKLLKNLIDGYRKSSVPKSK